MVCQYVVDARAVVGLPRSSERGPAGESVGAAWVEMTKRVHELPAVARASGCYLSKSSWFLVALLLPLSDTTKE